MLVNMCCSGLSWGKFHTQFGVGLKFIINQNEMKKIATTIVMGGILAGRNAS